MDDSLKEYLTFANKLADVASKTSMEYFRTSLKVDNKNDESPVTVADKNTELKIRVEKYGLEDKVILFGKTYQINNILNAFDINILTSKKECSPISLIESMATGVPCISTNVGNAIELIGDSGWIVNISDHKSIAKLITNINLDKNILKIKSNIARKRVEDFYPLEKMINKYNKLYI